MLCCIVLCCAVLCCVALRCVVLFCVALCCVVLCYVVLSCYYQSVPVVCVLFDGAYDKSVRVASVSVHVSIGTVVRVLHL